MQETQHNPDPQPSTVSPVAVGKRKWEGSNSEQLYSKRSLDNLVLHVEAALEHKNTAALATLMAALTGSTEGDNLPTRATAELLSKTCERLSEDSRQAFLHRMATQQQNGTRNYFGKHVVNVDSIVDITSFLGAGEKFMLGSLSRSWRDLINKQFMWHNLDPFPVPSFPKPIDMKLFLSWNKKKFSNSRSLQMPRVPTSSKLFRVIIEAMPQLSQLSLHNVAGAGSLRHVVTAAIQPARMLQLSVGLSTKVTPEEIVNTLKHFVNLRAVEFSFWHHEGSFDVLGEALGSLRNLQHLSLSQSFYYPHGYSLEQDPMKDEVFVRIAKNCVHLRDVYFSSFYGITNVTWKAFSEHCRAIRSFSIEDCGLCIDSVGAKALTTIAPRTLKNLVILPRYVGNVSSFLPSAGMSYVTEDALPILNSFRESAPHVVVFTRRDPVRHRSVMFINVMAPVSVDSNGMAQVVPASQGSLSRPWPLAYDVSRMEPCHELSSIFGILIDSGTSGERYYRHLVSIGHVAAFRMYLEHHLLPYSYFSDAEKYH